MLLKIFYSSKPTFYRSRSRSKTDRLRNTGYDTSVQQTQCLPEPDTAFQIYLDPAAAVHTYFCRKKV